MKKLLDSMDFIKTLEKVTKLRLKKKFVKKQLGDVEKTSGLS